MKTNLNSFFLRETDHKEIENIINTLKLRKSPGADKITSEILRNIKNTISKPLAYLINFTINSGICPKAFKIGIIKPIFKNGDKHEIKNYRPITLISSITKVFEKIMKERIENYLKKLNFISNKQFGFQKNKSTQDAICYLTNNIYQSMDNKMPCIGIFIDLAKAFDTVSHKILLEKLNKIGFRGKVLKLFKTYLEDRPQQVKIQNTTSIPKCFRYGVPQGTILGPLLFNIYLNDLFNLKCIGKIHSFADDTVIFYSDKNWQNIKQIIENDFFQIKTWFDQNLLTINFDKTKYLSFTSYSSNLPNMGTININKNIKISEAKNIKYLGIIIDTNLKWNLQIEYIIQKLRRLLPKFKLFKSFLDINHLEKMYFALVQSHLNYGILGWGGVNQNVLKNLETLQKWFLKIIYNKDYLYSSEKLYKESKKMDIKKLYYYNILIYIFKNINNINYNKHLYNTRFKKEITLKHKINKSIGQKNFQYLSSYLYDILPKKIKSIKSLFRYKNETKNWLLNKFTNFKLMQL